MFSNIGTKYPNEWAATILAIISIFVTAPIYYFYHNGERIRLNSKFAARIAAQREDDDDYNKGNNNEKVGGGKGNRNMSRDIEDDAAAPEFNTHTKRGRRH